MLQTHLVFCASARTTRTARLVVALLQVRTAKGRTCCVTTACIFIFCDKTKVVEDKQGPGDDGESDDVANSSLRFF